MNYMGYFIGIVVGILLGLVFVAFAIRYCRGSWKHKKSQYDERQKIAMGKAYRDGFWTLLVCVVVAVGMAKIPGLAGYSEILCITACFIGIGVYVVGCIMRDAYMGINDNAKRWTAVLIAIGVINVAGAAGLIMAEGILAGWINLLAVALVLVAIVTYGIRSAVKKREAEE